MTYRQNRHFLSIHKLPDQFSGHIGRAGIQRGQELIQTKHVRSRFDCCQKSDDLPLPSGEMPHKFVQTSIETYLKFLQGPGGGIAIARPVYRKGIQVLADSQIQGQHLVRRLIHVDWPSAFVSNNLPLRWLQ